MAYNQEFFLDLAAKGKNAWNAWRRDPGNKYERVTFADVDFSVAPRDKINFAEFEFGDHANFSRCKWRGGEWEKPGAFVPGRACFAGAAFGHDARFPGANFGNQANFTRATFRHGANFDGAAFGNMASFPGADFGHRAKLTGANFGHGARFSNANFADQASFAGANFGVSASFAGASFGATASFAGANFGVSASFNGASFGASPSFAGAGFGAMASFTGAAFGKNARFNGAAFGDEASFAGAVFKGRVEFTGMSEEQWARDVASALEMDEKARAALEKRHKDSWETTGSRLDSFLTTMFSRARFDGVAVFSGRSFEKTANFTNARFYSPPDFDSCRGPTRIDFTGAHIGFVRPGRLHWTKDTEVPLRLRSFRKVAEDTKNHDLERDLYIEERTAERGVYLVQRFKDWVRDPKKKWALIAHLIWIAVMGVYWALADYGRSFVRPAAWLVASGFLFYWCYGKVLAPLMPKAGPLADKYAHAVGMVALGNTVPFVGPLTIDSEIKKFLLCPSDNCLGPLIPPEGYQLLVLSQNLLSIILVFFIGLALRNYFKIK